ncbi:MAG: hypothetical protein JWP36_2268 [Paucimonas sp.]|jgi:uncharacterized membrane protein|nr:hypothetical protein [Paucimonas sp.]
MKSIQNLLACVEAPLLKNDAAHEAELDACESNTQAIVQGGYELLESDGLEAAAMFLSAAMSRARSISRESLAADQPELDACESDTQAIVQGGYALLESSGLEAAAMFLSAAMARARNLSRGPLVVTTRRACDEPELACA